MYVSMYICAVYVSTVFMLVCIYVCMYDMTCTCVLSATVYRYTSFDSGNLNCMYMYVCTCMYVCMYV